jgi:hypothetical protein
MLMDGVDNGSADSNADVNWAEDEVMGVGVEAVDGSKGEEKGKEGVEEDVDRTRRKGKGKAKETEERSEARTRRKGKGKAKETEEESEEEEDVSEESEEEEEGKAIVSTMEINALDTVCNAAIVSYCRLDVLDPPVPLEFGKWNNRLLDEKQAKKLAKEMTDRGMRPFGQGNLLPLVISRDKLEEGCIHMNPNAEAAPMLELTDEVIEEGTTLMMAGGRHRQRATEILKAQSDTMIENLEAEIERLEEGLEKSRARAKDEEVIRKLAEILAEERVVNEKVGIWGIVVYDAGKWK